MAHATAGARFGNDGQHNVLGRDARRHVTLDVDGHGFGAGLGQGLGGQHVLHLAGADAECQCAECSVGGCMGVPTDNGHARQRVSLLGSNDMHDALSGVPHGMQCDVELNTVFGQLLHLLTRHFVGDQVDVGHVQARDVGGHVVVHGGQRELRATYGAPRHTEPVEGLGRRHLVHQMQVDEQQIRLTGGLADEMLIP